MNKKELYIILSSTGTAFSSVIKLYTRKKYNHASLSLKEDLSEMYSFGRKSPINPIRGGFVKEDMEKGTFSWYPYTECVIYRVKVESRKYEKVERLLNCFVKHKDKYRYNLVGLLGVMVNKPLKLQATFFCSQFVAEILKRSGITVFKKPNELITPHDFMEIEEFEKIYEGKLYDYVYLKNRLTCDILAYKRFPVTQYFAQRIGKRVVNENAPMLSFQNDFLRPKKVYIDKKIQTFRGKKIG